MVGACSAYGGEASTRFLVGKPEGKRPSGDRIPVGGGARFSASVQTGPGSHPASYKTGTGSFPVVKRPERGVDHPSSADVKERVELYIYSPPGFSCPVLG